MLCTLNVLIHVVNVISEFSNKAFTKTRSCLFIQTIKWWFLFSL